MRVTIQILQRSTVSAQKVLHSFSHSAPSLRVVEESLKSVFFSPAWPRCADAFRVLSGDGKELCIWPATNSDLRCEEREFRRPATAFHPAAVPHI